MANLTIGGRTYDVEVRGDTVSVDGKEIKVAVREEKDFTLVKSGGVEYRVQLPPEDERVSGMEARVDYRPFTVEFEGPLVAGRARRPAPTPAPGGAARAPVKGAITAQLSGRVLRVDVKPGDAVPAGGLLLLIEAMKMENEIKAAADCTVKEVLVSEGDQVADGDVLVVIE